MTNKPSFTLYFKIGIIGMAEEVSESINISHNPALSEEENMQLLEMNTQIAQGRLQLSMMDLMVNKFPEYIKARAEEEGWDPKDLGFLGNMGGLND